MRKLAVIWALLTVVGVSQAFAVEWDPRSKDAEGILNEFERDVQKKTGKTTLSGFFNKSKKPAKNGNCYQESCAVWLVISKSRQAGFIVVNGKLRKQFYVSTGLPGKYETPNFDKRPNGRIYDQYSSKTFPGGNYAGLGNMPYAVFISGGFAVHGTPLGNVKNLGRKASHGCVRMHPIGGKLFNELVRAEGIENSWITIED